MPLKAVLEDIRKSGNKRAEDMLKEGEAEASQILDQARKDAESQGKRILEEGKTRLRRQEAVIEQQAIMRALQVHADARNKLIEDVINRARSSFPAIRNRADYIGILSSLTDECLRIIAPSLLEDQTIILHFDPRDKKISEPIVKKYDYPLKTEYDDENMGGCTAETEDGLIVAQNTIESRFEHAEPFLRQNLSLFYERKMSL